MFQIHYFNLFFFAFAFTALYGLWWKIFKVEGRQQGDKGLFWLAVSVGVHFLASAWWCFTDAVLPPLPYVWSIALPMTVFSTVNSIVIIKALQHFDYKPPFFADKLAMNVLLALGYIVILLSIFMHIGKSRSFDANSAYLSEQQDKNIQLKISEITLAPSVTDISLITQNRSGQVLDSTSFQRAPADFEGLKTFRKESRIADTFYTVFVVFLLLIFLLYTFQGRHYKVLWWLGIAFILLYATSQYLMQFDQNTTLISGVLSPAVNTLQIVFYLLVLLTWALEKMSPAETPGGQTQASPVLSAVAPLQKTSDFEPGHALKKRIEKVKEDALNLQFLESLCQGMPKQQFAKERNKRPAWAQERQGRICATLDIKNTPENLALFAVMYGLVDVSKVKIAPRD